MKVFITGISGMIGFHAAKQLKTSGHEVVGIDNFNEYYDVELKRAREKILKDEYGVTVVNDDIRSGLYRELLKGVDVVLHLAAYANPRHSLDYPQFYIDTNITGTQRLIEACEDMGIENVVYASSSCVMHGQPLPWNETDLPTHQNNPYGWSKRVNECQALHSKIVRTIGLRFFTVYGPYGRPDMALFMFTKAIIDGTPVKAFNNGQMWRDFTYVDDIVNGVEIVINKIANDKDEKYNEIYNIGYGARNNLMDFIAEIEKNVGKKAIVEMCPAHPADVPATWADTRKLQALGYKPATPIEVGVKNFVEWYRQFYSI